MKEEIYNIKMRAAKGGRHEDGGKHISGAEEIITEHEIEKEVVKLVKRAFTHSKGKADFINISLTKVENNNIEYIPSLDISTIKVNTYIEGRECILMILENLGIDNKKGREILNILINASPMRGAIILDIHSLKRLESDYSRGVRVSGMDWNKPIKNKLIEVLKRNNLYNEHTIEAVALASKVQVPLGIVAEICWSDDPDYTTGYVANKKIGYVRITKLKPFGQDVGGRIFCIDSSKCSLEDTIKWLENQITLVNTIPKINKEVSYEEFIK